MKALIEVDCFAPVKRPFRNFAPLNEKHFLKAALNQYFEDCVWHYGVLVKVLQWYLGAILFEHSKIFRFTSLLINS